MGDWHTCASRLVREVDDDQWAVLGSGHSDARMDSSVAFISAAV
jgi:hypothetical protein